MDPSRPDFDGQRLEIEPIWPDFDLGWPDFGGRGVEIEGPTPDFGARPLPAFVPGLSQQPAHGLALVGGNVHQVGLARQRGRLHHGAQRRVGG